MLHVVISDRNDIIVPLSTQEYIVSKIFNFSNWTFFGTNCMMFYPLKCKLLRLKDIKNKINNLLRLVHRDKNYIMVGMAYKKASQ